MNNINNINNINNDNSDNSDNIKKIFLSIINDTNDNNANNDNNSNNTDNGSNDNKNIISERNNNTCLISNDVLEKNYITLDCKHKFNYVPLYNEILYQKTKKILDNNKLKLNEVKCPYCRNITTKLLPYFKYYNLKQIKGVNYPKNLTMTSDKCEFISKKTKTQCINNGCLTQFGFFCNKHCKYTIVEEESLNNVNKLDYEKYNKLNVDKLKEILKELGLKRSGLKKELIQRIIINKNKLNIVTN